MHCIKLNIELIVRVIIIIVITPIVVIIEGKGVGEGGKREKWWDNKQKNDFFMQNTGKHKSGYESGNESGHK